MRCTILERTLEIFLHSEKLTLSHAATEKNGQVAANNYGLAARALACASGYCRARSEHLRKGKSPMLSTRKHWLGLGLAAVLLLPGCWVVNFNPFTAEQEVSDTFKTKATPYIVVDTFNGAIDVTPGEKGIVEARVTKRAGGSTQEEAEQDLEHIEVTMKQEGDKIEIKVGKTDQSMWSNRGASVDLQVPEGTVLDVRTTNGKVN